MFESATLKLTGWYLLIIMVISLLFSLLIYQSASSELQARLEQFGTRLPQQYQSLSTSPGWLQKLRDSQADEAAHNILVNLIYINCLVLATGGVASYLMARRTLRPIQEAHETQSRFVSDASHELRTPLAVMKTELEVLLRDRNITEKDMHEQLESNLQEVNKLSKLSQTLLSLSKMDYDSLIHEKVSLTNAVESLINRYDSTGKRIVLKRFKKPLNIDAHQPSIEELFTILIDNALKYSPEDSKVVITLSTQSNKAVFKIANSGEGISAEDLPHIFDRFYRADNARSSNQKTSFGLGLSLAKTIVELHHGELSASSAPHETTTFTVLLPLYKDSTTRNISLNTISKKITTKKS
jgi:two-component system sensor histidine kinase CiaH